MSPSLTCLPIVIPGKLAATCFPFSALSTFFCSSCIPLMLPISFPLLSISGVFALSVPDITSTPQIAGLFCLNTYPRKTSILHGLTSESSSPACICFCLLSFHAS